MWTRIIAGVVCSILWLTVTSYCQRFTRIWSTYIKHFWVNNRVCKFYKHCCIFSIAVIFIIHETLPSVSFSTGFNNVLTHWGRVTHICVSRLTTIGSDNGLSPSRRQAIIWNNAGILLIGILGINFSEIVSEIHIFSYKKMRLKMSSGKWRQFCLRLNVLNEGHHLRFLDKTYIRLLWKIRLLDVLKMLTGAVTLQWRHNGRDGISNHQPYDCLLNCLFRRRSKKTSKLRVTGLCAWNSPVTGEFPAQRASNEENVSLWWRHHVL